MSVAQIERELSTLDTTELDALETALRREKGRRNGNVLSAQETRLFEIINQPLPGGDDLRLLREKRAVHSLAEDELTRLIALENEREVAWACKLQAVAELAQARGQEFEALYQQLGLALRGES